VISRTETVVQAAAADSEVRVAMINRDLTNATTKLREAETRIDHLEAQVWSLSMGKSQAEACAKVWEDRAVTAEARAVEAEANMLDWEARAAIAESKLAGSTKSANDRERETDTATALLAKECEKRVAAESRAIVAEGSLGCLQARVQTLAREVAMAEVRAQERISAAENQAAQRMRDAEKRVGQAEQRAQSCDRSASSVIAEFRKQTSLSPRKSATRSLCLGTMTSPRNSPQKGSANFLMTSPRRLQPGRRFSLGSPQTAESKLHSNAVEVVCSKAPLAGKQAELREELSHGVLSGSGSEATTALPSASGLGSASGLSIPDSLPSGSPVGSASGLIFPEAVGSSSSIR